MKHLAILFLLSTSAASAQSGAPTHNEIIATWQICYPRTSRLATQAGWEGCLRVREAWLAIPEAERAAQDEAEKKVVRDLAARLPKPEKPN